jgi:predicted glycoside hydrolase/deacetylase ChbG (UPF0249 family)
MAKHLIVNADDFGASTGVNRGIIECHERGILTSASLMVTGAAADEAAALAKTHPGLAVGLHWDVWGEDEREFDLGDLNAVGSELERQLERFHELIGRPPSHVDSHRHVHREDGVWDRFVELVAALGVPVRGDGRVTYLGGFYAQWEWKVTNLEYVSVPFLQRMLRDEVGDGWTELGCHPGYMTDDYATVYAHEREAEVRSLTDPRVRETIEAAGIRLASFEDFRRAEAR